MKVTEYRKIVAAVLGLVDEGVHVVDAEGNTIIYNSAMSKLEKMEVQDVLGKPFRMVFPNIEPGDSTLMAALERGKITNAQQQTYQNRDGREITTINSTIPVLDGERVIGAIEIAKNITHLQEMSRQLLRLQSETRAPEAARERLIKKYDFGNLIGQDPEFCRVMEMARRAADSNASVYIYGETGTGKELVAQSIHFAGPRREKPFLAQNCAALPESLLEGILFGTARGGFTGAVDRAGLFEQASGGTLLLDEISAMPMALQGKLLRVLQEEYIRRVGGSRDIPVDVRIIATANQPAQELMDQGLLRKDLYYRLNVINLSIPPLRQRREDILLLAEFFLDKYNRREGKAVWMLAEDAKEKLLACNYPGNVRELENIMRRALAMAGGEHVLTAAHLLVETAGGNAGGSGSGESQRQLQELGLERYLAQIEKAAIDEALANEKGNISRAAAALGIKRQTLQHKLKKNHLSL